MSIGHWLSIFASPASFFHDTLNAPGLHNEVYDCGGLPGFNGVCTFSMSPDSLFIGEDDEIARLCTVLDGSFLSMDGYN